MSILDFIHRWWAERTAARSKYEVVIFFQGPLTLWSGKAHENDIICRRRFRYRIYAEAWARSRLDGFDRCDFTIGEIG